MYNCDICDTTTPAGTPLNRVPDGLRVRRYRARSDANFTHVHWKKKAITRDDPGGVGYEWRGMLRACPTCYQRYESTLKEELYEKAEERVEQVLAAK